MLFSLSFVVGPRLCEKQLMQTVIMNFQFEYMNISDVGLFASVL